MLVDSVGYDLKKIPEPQTYQPPSAFWTFVKNVIAIAVFSGVIFFSVNLPAYLVILKYRLSHNSVSNLPAAPATEQYAANSIFISKINVKAPIQWDIQSADILNDLQKGTVHIAGTGHPGEGKNIFITGHSSNFWWIKGDYNTVFALLPQLNAGDEIVVTYQDKIQKYVVEKTVEVSPKDVKGYVITPDEKLTLMTCVPVGTNLRRLLVIAKPI